MRRKLCAVVLLISVSLSMFACSKGKGLSSREPEYITEDSLWFGSSRYELESGFDGWGSGLATYGGLIYADSEQLLIDEDLFYGNDPDNEVHKLVLYDTEGNAKMSMDLKQVQDELTDNGYSSNKLFFIKDSDIYCLDNRFDPNGHQSWLMSKIDTASASFGEWEEVDGLSDELDWNYNIQRVEPLESGLVRLYALAWADGDIKVFDIGTDLSVTQTDISADLSKTGLVFAIDLFKCSEDKLLVTGYDASDSDIYILVDLESSEVTQVENEQFIKGRLLQAGSSLCYSDGYAFYRFDPDTCCFSEFINYDNCNVNRFEVKDTCPVYVDDDEMILFGVTSTGLGSSRMLMYDLKKSESNPNAGKMILTAASLVGGMDNATSEAIFLYNQSDGDAFIKMDPRYDIQRDYENSFRNSYEYIKSADFVHDTKQREAEMSNRLIVDLIAGDGPDIILNGSSFPGLESGECLIDLTDYITELDSSLYFPQILGSNRYQIPFGVCLEGLVYDASKTDGEIPAPTFEQYRDFVETVCGGVDPLSVENGRTQYFLLLFENMYDSFKDGKGHITLDNDEFRQLAEFCKDRPVNATTLTGADCTDAFYQEDVYYGQLSAYDNVGVMGLPSAEGTLPRLVITCSAGITGSCPDKDAAWEFIKVLLSDDVQRLVGSGSLGTAVNREVLRSNTQDAIERHNEYVRNYKPVDQWDTPPKPDNEAVTDIYIDALDQALPASYCDPDILIVMFEEIQPYFAGDMTLDEVIPVMENRCNLIIDEKTG